MTRKILFTAAIALGGLAITSHDASAFCGFYVGGAKAEMFNNATQVVLMRQGTTTVLSMQNNYQGPPEGFALVVPVPVVIKEDQVKTLPRELFDKVDTLSAPRLVEYWEQDPCAPEPPYEVMKMAPPTADYAESAGNAPVEEKVKIEAQFSVAEYDVVVLSATESTALDTWLRANKYQIPKGAEPLLRPYVASGTKFFVAKVDPAKVKFENGMATLSPLRFHYDSPEFALPIRLGMANSKGTQDLIVNILASQRYEVANYPNTTIPTNIVVRDAVRERFGEFYAALFDETMRKNPGAVVTEYAWDASTCDPCPGPTLDGNDLATLGADVISSKYQDLDAWSMTLTRLHARYGTDIKDDLVFRSAAGIVGGRDVPDAQGRLAMDVKPDSYNNFQGRYAILHPWTGDVSCPSPTRGEWGGPPSGIANELAGGPKAATNLAFAPRGQLDLAQSVAVDVPAVGIQASPDVPAGMRARKGKGCACDTAGSAGHGAAWLATASLLMIALRRRRQA